MFSYIIFYHLRQHLILFSVYSECFLEILCIYSELPRRPFDHLSSTSNLIFLWPSALIYKVFPSLHPPLEGINEQKLPMMAFISIFSFFFYFCQVMEKDQRLQIRRKKMHSSPRVLLLRLNRCRDSLFLVVSFLTRRSDQCEVPDDQQLCVVLLF